MKKSYSLKNVSPVSLKNVIKAIENKGQNSAILREINADISIRTGKFGPYVFYKSNNMTKPIFINMKKSNITMKLSNANIEEIVYDNY